MRVLIFLFMVYCIVKRTWKLLKVTRSYWLFRETSGENGRREDSIDAKRQPLVSVMKRVKEEGWSINFRFNKRSNNWSTAASAFKLIVLLAIMDGAGNNLVRQCCSSDELLQFWSPAVKTNQYWWCNFRPHSLSPRGSGDWNAMIAETINSITLSDVIINPPRNFNSL